MVADGTDRTRSGVVVEEPGVCARGAGDGRVGAEDYLSPPGAKHSRPGDRLRHLDDSADHANGSVSFVSRSGRAGAVGFVGQSCRRRHTEHRHLSLAIDLSGRHDGVDVIFTEFPGRWLAGRARSADEDHLILLEVRDLRTYFETDDGL